MIEFGPQKVEKKKGVISALTSLHEFSSVPPEKLVKYFPVLHMLHEAAPLPEYASTPHCQKKSSYEFIRIFMFSTKGYKDIHTTKHETEKYSNFPCDVVVMLYFIKILNLLIGEDTCFVI